MITVHDFITELALQCRLRGMRTETTVLELNIQSRSVDTPADLEFRAHFSEDVNNPEAVNVLEVFL